MPKADWSGLENPTPGSIEPSQYRSPSVSTQAKSQKIRTEGMEIKFSKGKNFILFSKEVMIHFKENGLDTVTYAIDPSNSFKVVSVLEEHGKFEVKSGTKLGNDLMKNVYDQYDIQNSKDARKFLFNSVDEELKKQLYESLSESPHS